MCVYYIMSAETGLMLASGLVSLGIYGVSCLGKRNKVKLDKMKYSAIVMSKHTGKSSLCGFLTGHDKMKVIDVSDSIKYKAGSNSDVEYLMEAKEYVEKVKKELPTYKLVLLCDTIEQAKFLLGKGLETNILPFTPSQGLFCDVLKGLNAVEITEITKQRLELISQSAPDRINVFNSFDELYSSLKGAYKLKNQW